jgi:hypothetical protein
LARLRRESGKGNAAPSLTITVSCEVFIPAENKTVGQDYATRVLQLTKVRRIQQELDGYLKVWEGRARSVASIHSSRIVKTNRTAPNDLFGASFKANTAKDS